MRYGIWCYCNGGGYHNSSQKRRHQTIQIYLFYDDVTCLHDGVRVGKEGLVAVVEVQAPDLEVLVGAPAHKLHIT